mmetsp:Transcript_18224/g.25517  ORF Transcript_18224/g.25517 Transcript_18224/m.25517 type:complete len:647 (+) Transcript_18224:90-2030(+)
MAESLSRNNSYTKKKELTLFHEDVLGCIIVFLDWKDITNLCRTCRKLNLLLKRLWNFSFYLTTFIKAYRNPTTSTITQSSSFNSIVSLLFPNRSRSDSSETQESNDSSNGNTRKPIAKALVQTSKSLSLPPNKTQFPEEGNNTNLENKQILLDNEGRIKAGDPNALFELFTQVPTASNNSKITLLDYDKKDLDTFVCCLNYFMTMDAFLYKVIEKCISINSFHYNMHSITVIEDIPKMEGALYLLITKLKWDPYDLTDFQMDLVKSFAMHLYIYFHQLKNATNKALTSLNLISDEDVRHKRSKNHIPVRTHSRTRSADQDAILVGVDTEKACSLMRTFKDAVAQAVRKRQAHKELANAFTSITDVKITHNPIFQSNNKSDVAVPCWLMKFKSQDIAFALTQHAFIQFKKIQPSELILARWSKRGQKTQAPNVQNVMKRNQVLSNWIVYQILEGQTPSQRIECLKQILKIASHLLKYNNHNDVWMIMNALQNAAVTRLKLTWKLIPDKYAKIYDNLLEFCNTTRGYSPYRQILAETDTALPCVCYIGMFLADLAFIEDGNATLLDGLRNFQKASYICNTIQSFYSHMKEQDAYPNSTHQKTAATHNTIKEQLLGVLTNPTLISFTDQGFYDLSLHREPRQPPNQAQH